ncbi:MAG: acyl-CoA reductase [Cyclobacteriaceae bacterium]|nr:acyl-CoA reductase [Cytophagales bacterium]MCZ8328201.1 acyl-CoA reductase [Cyclobacteriaceae bacterium]
MENRLHALQSLKNFLEKMDNSLFIEWCNLAKAENGWFTEESIRTAIDGIIQLLDEKNLRSWLTSYRETKKPKTIAIIMAGNLPLVGFHDVLCTYIIGHTSLLKLSSKDSRLFPLIIDEIKKHDPEARIKIENGKLSGFDAVIATGSDNASRYFDYYFAKYPHIIRKNRTSAAILNGEENPNELALLGKDVFQYFGLGCRNVSSLLVPVGFNFSTLLDSWQEFSSVSQHHKYFNNYEYQKAIKLINAEPHLDNGFVLLCESTKLVSPISTVHYQFYRNVNELTEKINFETAKLQCIVGNNILCNVNFGQTQRPAIWSYADNIDTMRFLEKV